MTNEDIWPPGQRVCRKKRRQWEGGVSDGEGGRGGEEEVKVGVREMLRGG